MGQKDEDGYYREECHFFFQRISSRPLIGQHRMPLYFIPVFVSQRLARTLLKSLLSQNSNSNTQFKHASRHPGA